MTTTITANDEPTEIEADVDKRFSSIVVNLPVQQTGTGTPSPSNPRPFAKWTDVSLYVSDAETADEPTLTIELPTPMYGGKIDMVRGEIATTYNSKESGTDWEMTEEGQFRCQVSAYNNGDETSTNVADLYAVHYETVSNKDAYDATDDLTCGLATIAGTTYLYVNDAQYTTLESFATHIADEVFVFRAHIPMSDATEPHIVYLPEGTSYVWAEGAYYVETVSGTPPLSLPNSLGKPLKAWSVELSPYQDLHGYDNPWPAGGGKNLFPQATISLGKPNNRTTNVQFDKALPSGTYTLSYTRTGTYSENGWGVELFNSENTKVGEVNRSTGRIVLSGDAVRAYCYMPSTSYDNNETLIFSNIQVESGSTATSYAPYSNICPILGTNKVTVWTSGKNLIKTTGTSKTESEVTWTVNDDGTISVSGTATGYSSFVVGTAKVDSSMGYITISGIGTATNIVWSSVILQDDNDNTVYTITTGSSALSFTVDMSQYPTATKVYVSVKRNNNVATSGVVKPMVEFGSTASDFVPYVAPSSTVITLPNTLYGGTYDAVTGQGTIDRASVDLGTLTWSINAQYSIFYSSGLADIAKSTRVAEVANALCESYPVVAANTLSSTDKKLGFGALYSGSQCINIVDTDYSDVESFTTAMQGIKCVFELATPTTLTVPSVTIPTPKGTATTWATADDGTVDSMEVQYIRIAEQES